MIPPPVVGYLVAAAEAQAFVEMPTTLDVDTPSVDVGLALGMVGTALKTTFH